MTITLQADRNPFDTLIEFVNQVENPGGGERAKVATAITRGFAENFSTEGAASGTPWEQLAPRTVGVRRQLGWAGEHPMLVRTGDYRRSWVEAGAADHVEVFEKTGTGWLMDVGSESERARILNEGGVTNIDPWQIGRDGQYHFVGGARSVYVPPRPVNDLGAKAEAGLGDVLDFVIDEIAQRVG